MTRVWLIRHGEPAEEARGRCYGSLDVGLSEKGRDQMNHVAAYLKSEPITCVYTSPRSRAQEGAHILGRALSHSVEVIQDLREINFGEFEGLPYDEIAARYPDLYREWMEHPTEVRFPTGENFPEMRSRVLSAFEGIQRKHEDETIAIVSHGGVNRIVLAAALEIPDRCIFRLAQDHAAVNLLVRMHGFPVVQLLNQAHPTNSVGKGLDSERACA